MSQSRLMDHDRQAFLAYWGSETQFERYRHTVERYARIHAKKFKPRLKRVIHLLESGEVIMVTDLPDDKKELIRK